MECTVYEIDPACVGGLKANKSIVEAKQSLLVTNGKATTNDKSVN